MEKIWTRVVGDALAYEGPCLVHDVIFWPDANTDYVDVYDGRDSTSGKKFMRMEAAVQVTWQVHFGTGVPFSTGVYIDGVDTAVQTTVVLTPQPE